MASSLLTADPIQTVLDLLDGVRQSGDQFVARCPAHDDSTASLSVSSGSDGRCLVRCHAGCPPEDVVAAVGLQMSDLMVPGGYGYSAKVHNKRNNKLQEKPGQILASYDYTDARGDLLYQVCRHEVIDQFGAVVPNKKTFRQRHPDGNGGWIRGRGNSQLVPYRLCDLNKSSGMKFIFEGEKDVDLAIECGLSATCNAMGAGKWEAIYDKWFEDRDVCIIPDNDEPGRKHAECVALSLQGTAKSVRILELPGLQPKGDFSDWCDIEFGDSAEPDDIRASLVGLVQSTPEWIPTPKGMPDLRPEEYREQQPEPRIVYERITSRELAMGDYTLEYLIEDAMVAGQPLIIAGPQKTLKTSFIIDAAVSLAIGGYFLGKLKVARSCRVTVMTGESGLATIQDTARRVCIAARQHLDECDKLFWSPDIPKFGSVPHIDALRDFLAADSIEVLFIDPAYLAMPAADAGNLMAQGELLRSISEVCQEMGVTMVLAHHTKKNTGADPFAPPELHHIAWAGFQEFARQWWLIGRRELYEPGTGDHKLWFSVGGSAGHSALWAVDVSEGVRTALSERRWEVSLTSPAKARGGAKEHREQLREKKAAEKAERKAEADRKAVVGAMHKLKRPETQSEIAAAARLPNGRTKAALLELRESGDVVEGEPIVKGNGRPYNTFKLRCEEN